MFLARARKLALDHAMPRLLRPFAAKPFAALPFALFVGIAPPGSLAETNSEAVRCVRTVRDRKNTRLDASRVIGKCGAERKFLVVKHAEFFMAVSSSCGRIRNSNRGQCGKQSSNVEAPVLDPAISLRLFHVCCAASWLWSARTPRTNAIGPGRSR